MGEPAGGAGESAELCERWGWTGRSATPQHALSRHSRSQQDNRRQGLYYSPPGTSYTIVERPASSHGHHPPHTYGAPAKLTRGGYLGGSAGTFAPATNGKKRPISPEQVLRLLGQGGATAKDRTRRHSPASSPSSTTHHATYRPEPRPYSSAGLTGGMTGPGGGGMTGSAPGALDPATRTVTMSRDMPDATHGFGICVKGGKEAGVGVYISRVEEGSVAERSGLRPGDAILQVNGMPFNGISHEDALKMLKSCRQLSMTVRSGGAGGGAGGARAACSWMDRQGRPASPPPPQCMPASQHYTPYSGVKDRAIRRVDLCIEPGQSLGLMIRGGLEYNLGIYITGVDKESVADRAGLMIGDQILEVNGQSFMEVTHDEAVGTLKQHKRMSLLVRDVGKVPHSCTAYADRHALSPSHVTGGGGGGGGEVRAVREARGMVEEKARSLLPASELPALLYYMSEYAQRRMPADAFFTHLLDVLDKPEKLTLLTEMREFVLSEDRTRFDELVYRRDHTRHAQKRRGCLDNHFPPSTCALERDCHDPCAHYFMEAGAGRADGAGLEHRSPSEDSGLGLAAHEHAYRSGGRGWGRGGDVLLPEDELPPDGLHQDYSDEDRHSRRHSSPLGSREGSTAALHRAAGPPSANHPLHPPPAYDDPCGYLEGLRSSLGGWTQKVKSWYWGRPLELAHKLSRSFDMKEEGALLEGAGGMGGMRRHQSMQRLGHDPGLDEHARAALVVHDHHGNLHITVKKTKPILGIAIEGGANTKHLLPRIINIHEHGAAYEAGGLEVGQLILSVDGRRVDGMQHQDVARLIAESFAQRDKPNIEFLVVEAKKSNLEPKPTALIFLEA